MLKRTPLFSTHQVLGARLIEFGGWEMPVQYSGIVQEHRAVRNAAGLFDICHMGEVKCSGPSAEAFLNKLLTNNVANLSVGQGQYTIMCTPEGGTVDDLYVYRVADQEYLLVINASRTNADLEWIQHHHQSRPEGQDCSLENLSEVMGALALQGPRSPECIQGVFPYPSTGGSQVQKVTELRKNQVASFDFPDTLGFYVGRTGYTGEDGFEIIGPGAHMEKVWLKFMEQGKSSGLVPAGLGARDTLRMEVCYPLYGHELDEGTSPVEAGLNFAIAMDKPDFIGKEILEQQKKEGPLKKLVAFQLTGKTAPPRSHYPIYESAEGGEPLGEVTSGTQSPSLGVGIGMGFVKTHHAKAGNTIQIEVRGRRVPAVIVRKPIYKKS